MEIATANRSSAASIIRPRIASIDIFRGLTVLVMVFVDNLDFVKGLPWWTYHMPREINGMTYVDMVFPAFLFVMGMSIPLSVSQRTARGDSEAKTWMHIFVRSLSLVALGLFIANGPQVDAAHTNISAVTWDSLGFLAIALLWGNSFASPNKSLRKFSKVAGLLLFVLLAASFRRVASDGTVHWLDFSDWEILGLLGWAYLLVGSLYLLFRKNFAILFALLVVLCALNVLSVAGWFDALKRFPPIAQPFEAGLSSMTMAGLVAYQLIFGGAVAKNMRSKLYATAIFAALLAFVAWLLTPFGISKLRDTPTWCLYSSAANVLIVLLLHRFIDRETPAQWTTFFREVGSNALLAYMLAYVAYFVPLLFRLTADGTSGAYGILRSVLFAVLIFAITTTATRLKFRLQV
jgi:heparan-alpha-glucosaminide N-acetyltransferase